MICWLPDGPSSATLVVAPDGSDQPSSSVPSAAPLSTVGSDPSEFRTAARSSWATKALDAGIAQVAALSSGVGRRSGRCGAVTSDPAERRSGDEQERDAGYDKTGREQARTALVGGESGGQPFANSDRAHAVVRYMIYLRGPTLQDVANLTLDVL